MHVLIQSLWITQNFDLRVCFKLKLQIRDTSILWNFELTVFEYTVHFKYEMIKIWQTAGPNFELKETSN